MQNQPSRSNQDMWQNETKTEMLKARTTKDQKALFQRAAELHGQTLADFMLSGLHDLSMQIIHQHEIVELNSRNRDAFVDALLNPPPLVSPDLVAAMSRLEDAKKNEKITFKPRKPDSSGRVHSASGQSRSGKLSKRK